MIVDCSASGMIGRTVSGVPIVYCITAAKSRFSQRTANRMRYTLSSNAITHALKPAAPAALPRLSERSYCASCLWEPDVVSNLQWQTIVAARVKDAWERAACTRR
jgi:hypothetical protein